MELFGIKRQLASTAGLVGLVALWASGALIVGNQALLPSPLAVGLRLVNDVTNPLFWNSVWHTFAESLLGCVFGTLFALPLAYLIYKNAWLSAACAPLVSVSQAIPSVAIAPLLVIWIGYGLVAISVLCALMVFFPILVNTVLGLKSLPADVIEAARLDGAGGLTLLALIEAPLALPALLAGLRNGFTLSVIGAVVGEFVMGGQGLGARLSLQSAAADMTGLFSTVTVLCFLAALAFASIAAIERHSQTIRALR
ncbi:ABC transporter permease subunit [Corynebacterium sp. CCM 8862]|uniref:ABC transporter permease subunit n=1 Tax=Corynebacterium mendelii TaxID=2765362 RepID=A0A939E002_9CORY|nr:ABC transporter permease subunit [Corynebacterium mendelii]MBN9643934.1 ABC transporter permease subunit [Corynebacterium mendelii]